MLTTKFELWACSDCMMAHCNGDTSGNSETWHADEYARTLEDWAKDGVHIAANFDSNTEAGMIEFSSSSCDLCTTHLAGSRYRFAALENVALPISDDQAREVIAGYQECAVWLATDDDGESVDHCDLEAEAASELSADCVSFLQAVPAPLLLQYALATGDQWARFGHDFWLTRNGHGAGFWDRGDLVAAQVGEKLSEHARAEGSRDTLFNDNTNEIEVY